MSSRPRTAATPRRVYIVAERVEFLASRNRSNGQGSPEASPEQPAETGAAREPHTAA